MFIGKYGFLILTSAYIIPFLSPTDWFAALDLKNAYLTHTSQISLIHSGGGQFAKHIFLFFHLRVFTKRWSAIATHLRRDSIHAFLYLDNWLIKAP